MGLAELIGADADNPAVAIVDGDRSSSRRELFRSAVALAANIDEVVPPGARVGAIASGDIPGVVGLVAALLSGRGVAMLPSEIAEPDDWAAGINCAALLRGDQLSSLTPHGPAAQMVTSQVPPGGSPEKVVLFTSGTTHRPRGVRLSESNVVANLTAMLRLAVDWRPQDRVGQILTLSHSFGLSMALLALATQTPLVMLPDGPPSRRLTEAMNDGGVTVFACVPYFLRLMARRGIELGAGTAPDLAHLYLAGGGISDAELATVIPHFTGETCLMYGFTEATARVAVRRSLGGAPANSVGLPLPGTHVQIVDEAGAPVPTGVTGRIQVRSPSLMIGYLGEEPRAPSDAFTTTDLGRLDEAGNLFVTGRQAEMMNFRGNRVSVVAIEAVVDRIDGVRESRLQPDSADEDAQGELLIEPEPDADRKAIRRGVLGTVTPKGIIRAISFVDELPRTRSGKALRRGPG